MSVQFRVLEALEANRGRYFSGEELAHSLNVSRSAVWKAVTQLRNQGYPIEAAPRRGYRLHPDSSILSEPGIRRYLTTTIPNLQVFPTITSTNTVLRELALDGAAEGTVLVAGMQTEGRGRRTHSFFSPADSGLYMSILLRPNLSAEDSLLITTCAAVSVAQAIEDCGGRRADIKWVNDVFCEGKKVCGILTEGSLDMETGGLQYAIMGAGINVYTPAGGFPEEIKEIAGPVFDIVKPDSDCRNHLAACILNRFFSYYPNLKNGALFEEYRNRSFVLGRNIVITNGGEQRNAVVLDLMPDFRLKVQESDGTIRYLSSGEVSILPKE